MSIRVTGCLVLALLAPQGHTLTPQPAAAHTSLLGRFQLTYFYVAEEEEGGARARWPIYAPNCGSVIAHTTEAFHRELSREGTGLLRDGRLVNFEEYCSCARPGFQGSRQCYAVLDRERFPWGRGARLGGTFLPLRPFRSVAVDPKVIPIGTRIYIPRLRGKRAPDGRKMDGCFRAEDTGRLIRGRRLDFFTGTRQWAAGLQRALKAERVTVHRGGPRCPAS